MYLSDGSLLTTNCLEPLLWMGCVYFAILAIKRDDSRLWLCFDVVAGLGMEEKYSIAVLGFAIVLGLALTEQRRLLRSKWMWLGGLAALLIFLPNLLWNVKYDFPFVQLIDNIRASGRDVVLSPGQYFAQQLLLMQPLAAPVWITGVITLLRWPRLKAFRFLGWSYLVALALFAGLQGKSYYLAPLVVPVLPIDRFVVYMNNLPIKVPRSEHSHMRAALPQHYADQFGWQEIVDEVNVAWIPAGERADCGIFAQDYGQAGAIDLLGKSYGLPPALSGHQTYFLWGPRGYSGNCLIVLDDRQEALEEKFDQVELVGVSTDNAYALERQVPVFICRGK
jgi:hypothetical protein